MTTHWQHTTVLLTEAVDALLSSAGEGIEKNKYVDATFGRGGHSRLILSRLPEEAQLIYGVTMEERGVSKTVSMHFNNEHSIAEKPTANIAEAVSGARAGATAGLPSA